MRNRMRSASYAVVAGAAMFLSLAATPAFAQVPGGSYLETCTDVRMSGDRLVAQCRRMDGNWARTALDISGCAGGVANTNGHLTCNYSGPGYGSSLERGYSSAPSRYYGYPQYYGFGR